MRIFRVPLGVCLATLSFGLAAGEPPSDTRRLSIGSTGVMCTVAPCPWRGIIDLDDTDRDQIRPLWSGETLPVLVATPDHAREIEAAWEDRRCLEIEGAILASGEPPSVRVDRIIGACA